MTDDLEKDMGDVIARFNALDREDLGAAEIDYQKAWEEVSAVIEQRGLAQVGGPFPDLPA